jgi:P-type Mg2+ transporter
VPFFRSRPSRPLLATTLACAAIGVALPYIAPAARLFGFRPLPLPFLGVLAAMIVTYMGLAQAGNAVFFRLQGPRSLSRRAPQRARRVARRAVRWRAHRPRV